MGKLDHNSAIDGLSISVTILFGSLILIVTYIVFRWECKKQELKKKIEKQ